MPPIRVLQVMPAMDAGGMETFVMNVYRTIDREKVQFDFLYHYDKPCFFDCLLYTSPSPRDISGSRMPSSA